MTATSMVSRGCSATARRSCSGARRSTATALGWIAARSHCGQGIATEAAAAWGDYAFGTLGLGRIVSMVSEENVASRRVAEKLGARVEREAVWDGLPMLMYAYGKPARG